MAVIFINTRKEAQIAADIANITYEDEFDADDFYRRYVNNVLTSWRAPGTLTRQEVIELIADAIGEHRAAIGEHRARTTRASRTTRARLEKRLEALRARLRDVLDALHHPPEGARTEDALALAAEADDLAEQITEIANRIH